MSDNKEQNNRTNSRRQLLKATIAGTGAVVAGKSLPEQWSRPLVESVTLPAHAQTSVISVGGPLLFTAQEVNASDWLLDKLVPTANAGFNGAEPSVIVGDMCVSSNPDGTVNVQVYVQYPSWTIWYPYFVGENIPQNTPTALVLQNGPCIEGDGDPPRSSVFTCTAEVAVVDGEANGTLRIDEEVIDPDEADTMAATDFSLSDPGCGISIVTSCEPEPL